MSRILITSGPTRQYLDPVRYLTNASSGRMGCALAQAALRLGHEVILVSGPVNVVYPEAAQLVSVTTTDDMLEACQRLFASCDGLIGAAAPCDYQPVRVSTEKIAKNGGPLMLHLIETPDIVATLGGSKLPRQWTVGFALETEDQRFRALSKLERKSCDLIVLNGPQAMNAADNSVELLEKSGQVVATFAGSKEVVADGILSVIEQRLIVPRKT
jgi:phosphopantothenoylcysteine decarboxylase / phosphopantothenate---cysteine ligase